MSGVQTDAYVTAFGFSGSEDTPGVVNMLGLPEAVAGDALFVGTFDGHEAALERQARVVVRGLPDGAYEVRLYGARVGDDAGLGRLARFRIGDAVVDLEQSDNAAEAAVFADVRPDARGEIVVQVGVSPDGTARFADLAALWVTRTAP